MYECPLRHVHILQGENEILEKETSVSLQEFMSSTRTNILLCSMNNFICCLLSLHKGIVVLTFKAQ
jgi:hypothetical protein